MHRDATPAQLENGEGRRARGGVLVGDGGHPPRDFTSRVRASPHPGIGGGKRLERIGGLSGQRADRGERGKVQRSGVRGYPGSHQDEKAQGRPRGASRL